METIISKEAAKVYIGIDVHRKQYTVTCIMSGEVIKRCRMVGTPASLIQFIKKFFSCHEVMTVYEAGFSGFRLHRELERAGIRSMVVHAASIEVSLKKSKTDKRDSLKMAEQLSGGRLKGIYVPSEEQELMRLKVRTREQLMRARTKIMNQVRMRLHQFGEFPIEYKGALRTEFVNGLIEQGLPEELTFSLKRLLAVKKSLEDEIGILNVCIREAAAQDAFTQVYRELSGIGTLTGYCLSSELGNLQQFSNERRLFSFVGLVPGEFSTDQTRRLGHISKQGRSFLRHLLVEAAWVAIRKDAALREVFDRIAARAGKKRAIVAIARKLIGHARALFRKQESYQMKYCCAA